MFSKVNIYRARISSSKPFGLHFISIAIVNFRCYSMCSSILFREALFSLIYLKAKKLNFINFQALQNWNYETLNYKLGSRSQVLISRCFKRSPRNDVSFHFLRALQRQTSRCAWKTFNAMTLITTLSRLIIWLLGVSMLSLRFACPTYWAGFQLNVVITKTKVTIAWLHTVKD